MLSMSLQEGTISEGEGLSLELYEKRFWNSNEAHPERCVDYVTECDIRMDFDTNEYPNIFVSRK